VSKSCIFSIAYAGNRTCFSQSITFKEISVQSTKNEKSNKEKLIQSYMIKNSAIVEERGAAPEETYLRFPPNFSLILEKTILSHT
jgi:hypothetical protein